MKKILPIVVISIIGTSLFTILLYQEVIQSVIYLALMGLLALICFAMYSYPRIRELDIKNARIVLNEIKKAKAEIFAREEDLRNMTIEIAKITSFIAAYQGRWGSEEGHDLKRQWYRIQTKKLIENIDLNEIELKEITKYSDLFDEIDATPDKLVKKAESDKLMKMIQEDIDKMSK